ncbi:MAG: glycine--tRNA ligase [Nanoarchaeota archaeon]|nr:glycine--tRNA ligase [Nanoarchaeota archaeon]
MFIVKKVIAGNDYYYLRDSKRVNGKVKAVTVAYLGKNKKEAEKKAREIINERKKGVSKKEQEGKESKEKKMIVMGNEEKEFLSFIQEGGFIWGPSPEIYGGVAGFYTYGPLGKLLKNKIENSVRRVFNSHGFREMEGPTVLPDVVWKASGHLDTFKDRIIKCKKCRAVFRADKLIEERFNVSADSFSDEKILKFIEDKGINCPSCGGSFEKKIESQTLMMKTKVAGQDSSLRPETATVTYLPFLRIYNYFRKKLPFSVYQIGKVYRDEISPRQHVLRSREFTQAEGQIFIDPEKKNDWEKYEDIKSVVLPFWDWKAQDKNEEPSDISIASAMKKGLIKSQAYAWCIWLAYMQFVNFGIPRERIRLRQHWPDEKAFYADDAWDIEANLNNYGWVELCGVHDRADYDLKQHGKASGVALEAVRENGEKFIPHILEIAFGTDRPTYALIDIFYRKKEVEEGKTMFKVPYHMAPIDVSIFPLMKKRELIKIAEEVKEMLENDFVIDYDVSGSIGRRYLRAASAGTPFAITIDYESLEKKDVTIRDRDTSRQIRVKISDLKDIIKKLLEGAKITDFGKFI